jgi:hypothetical protein
MVINAFCSVVIRPVERHAVRRTKTGSGLDKHSNIETLSLFVSSLIRLPLNRHANKDMLWDHHRLEFATHEPIIQIYNLSDYVRY